MRNERTFVSQNLIFHCFGDFHLFIWFHDIPNCRMCVFSVDDADEDDSDGGRDKASASSRSEFESVQVA